MGVVDFILNLAGLLLWLNWRSLRFDPLGKRIPVTLIGTLRRAEPRRLRRWHVLAALAALLFLRAVLYWQIGPGVGWASGTLNLGIIELSFRSDSFGRILLFSIFSFSLTLAVFYLWLLLFSILSGPEPFHRLVRMQLGPVDRWSRTTKILLPLALTASLWWLASWVLAWLAIIPGPISVIHRIEESLLISLGSFLAWKYAAVMLLALYLLNSYIYFGKHPFWKYVTAEAQVLLMPLSRLPLRVNRFDFAPIVGIVLVFLLAHIVQYGMPLPWNLQIPGLEYIYNRLPF